MIASTELQHTIASTTCHNLEKKVHKWIVRTTTQLETLILKAIIYFKENSVSFSAGRVLQVSQEQKSDKDLSASQRFALVGSIPITRSREE
jgi:hypothetical protein